MHGFAWNMLTVTGLACLLCTAQAQAPQAGTHPADTSTSTPIQCDVLVYGGTSGGVTAAAQAARMGRRVVLVEPGQRLGGLSSGGLGTTDVGSQHAKQVIGGYAREFYARVYRHYQRPESWTHQRRADYANYRFWDFLPVIDEADGLQWSFEPHVAAEIFAQFLNEAGVQVMMGERLQRPGGVQMDGLHIHALIMESGRRFSARMFVDASYEGDLMALTGVSFTVGRESNAQYGEQHNGVLLNEEQSPVDPYRIAGDASSGLMHEISATKPGLPGSADDAVQAYTFRLTLTDVPENRLPITQPAHYDAARYELLLRYLQGGHVRVLGNHQLMPNRKSDTNNGNLFFDTDYIGGSWRYPDATYAERERIIAIHRNYQQGLLWFLANDPRVPAAAREQMAPWGLARDEFEATGGWTPQLYIREARRMVSDYVMTELDCNGTRRAPDPIGMGGNPMDSHAVRRCVDATGALRIDGFFITESVPYGISYRSIVPAADEAENLLVPVCLSASHVAFGSIRMEPVFMILGQAAGTAAALAIEDACSVQQLDYNKLRARLLADDQRLELAR